MFLRDGVVEFLADKIARAGAAAAGEGAAGGGGGGGVGGDEGGEVAAALEFGSSVPDAAVGLVVEGWRGCRAGLMRGVWRVEILSGGVEGRNGGLGGRPGLFS